MKYGVVCAESISTSVETVIESMPFLTSSGTLMEVSEPLKASPCAGSDQSAVPFTVPSRPLPEASVTVAPEAPSSLYQRARPSVTSAASAAWAGTMGAARPGSSDAAVRPARWPARRLARVRGRAKYVMWGSPAEAWRGLGGGGPALRLCGGGFREGRSRGAGGGGG